MLEPPEGYHWELDSDIMHETRWILVEDHQPGRNWGGDMKRVICWIKGHNWHTIHKWKEGEDRRCLRCGEEDFSGWYSVFGDDEWSN